MLEKIVCPGCGTVYESIENLGEWGQCTKCKYENGLWPNRLLTLREIIEEPEAEYMNVALDLFLASVLALCGYEENDD